MQYYSCSVLPEIFLSTIFNIDKETLTFGPASYSHNKENKCSSTFLLQLLLIVLFYLKRLKHTLVHFESVPSRRKIRRMNGLQEARVPDLPYKLISVFQFLSNFAVQFSFLLISFSHFHADTGARLCLQIKAQNVSGPWNGIFNTNFIYCFRNEASFYIEIFV